MKKSRVRLLDDLALLWVFGLACVLAFLGVHFLPFEGEQKEWMLYLLLGSAFPALVAALASDHPRIPAKTAKLAKYALIAAFGALFLAHFGEHLALSIVVAALAQAALVFRFWPIRGRYPQPAVAFLATALASAALWVCASRLLWFDNWEPWITASAIPLATVVVGGSLAAYAASPATRKPALPWFSLSLSAATFVSFFLASTRADHDVDAAFFVGSAELVRQGGWLLWDVPSQYGFLNILSMAIAPFDTVWQSVYAVNSFFLLASGWLVFSVFRRIDRSATGMVFASLASFAATYLMPGYVQWLLGPNRLPSVAGFRFIWCYALLFAAIKCGEATMAKRPLARLWVAGSAIWAVGALWSFESAVFSSLVWFPPYYWMLWRHLRPGGALAKWALLPFAILSVAILAIVAYYLARLGHSPDWQAFVEFALAYQAGFGALPIAPYSGAWMMLAAFGACLAVLASVVFKAPRDERSAAAPVALAAAGMLWATSSYFVSRSHENNVSNLAPLFMTSLAATIHSTRLAPSLTLGSWMPRLALIPLTAAIFACTYGNVAPMRGYLTTLAQPRSIDTIHEIIPTSNAAVIRHFHASGGALTDPVAYHHLQMLPSLSDETAPIEARAVTPRFWLPFAPASQLSILPVERQRVYVERFIERNRTGGWLLTPRAIFGLGNDRIGFAHSTLMSPEVLRSYLGDRFTVTNTIDSDEWRMERFELK